MWLDGMTSSHQIRIGVLTADVFSTMSTGKIISFGNSAQSIVIYCVVPVQNEVTCPANTAVTDARNAWRI